MSFRKEGIKRQERFEYLNQDILPRMVQSKQVSGAILSFLPLVIDAYQNKNWRFLTNKIQQHLRNHKSLHSQERRFVNETLIWIIRYFNHFLYLLDGYPLNPGSIFAVCFLQKFKQEKDHENHRFDSEKILLSIWPKFVDFKVVNDRYINLLKLGSTRELSTQWMALMYSFPDWMVEKLIAQFGRIQAEQILIAQLQRAPLTVRVNLLKTSRHRLQKDLSQLGVSSDVTEFSPQGLVLHTRENVYAMKPFLEGKMELQDEGSQCIGLLVLASPQMKVLDACAGAGGKTLLLGALMHNKGRLTALDTDENKLIELRKRARRAGLTNVYAQKISPKGVIQGCSKASFDRVLCDVPCSGSGVLRRNPESKWQITPENLDVLASQQFEIIKRFSSYVKPNGWLIYATCSIFKEENEDVVNRFLASNPQFSLLPISAVFNDGWTKIHENLSEKPAGLDNFTREDSFLGPVEKNTHNVTNKLHLLFNGNYLKLLPNSNSHDGFFAAVLRRTD